MPEKEIASLAALHEVHEDKHADLMACENVVGVGIGNKVTEEEDTGELCLSVFVSQKLEPSLLRKKDLIPKAIGRFKTDVVETGIIFAGAGPMAEPATRIEEGGVSVEVLTTRVRPAEGGYSVGHYQITAGTYATAVYDSSSYPGMPRKYYVLSNNHVLANSNAARIGDPVLQPGPYDGGIMGRDTIARLSRFVPIQFAGGPNYVDAALAEGNFDVLDREIYWIGYVRGAVAPAIGMSVQKTGRTTNYTTGRITAINAVVNVSYGGGQTARFEKQVLSTSMSAGGDSGSLLLDMDNKAVGLLFAGSSSVTVYNDIRYVQALLGIRIA